MMGFLSPALIQAMVQQPGSRAVQSGSPDSPVFSQRAEWGSIENGADWSLKTLFLTVGSCRVI